MRSIGPRKPVWVEPLICRRIRRLQSGGFLPLYRFQIVAEKLRLRRILRLARDIEGFGRQFDGAVELPVLCIRLCDIRHGLRVGQSAAKPPAVEPDLPFVRFQLSCETVPHV